MFSGKKTHSLKLIDEDGNIYQEILDDASQEVDSEALEKEEIEVKQAKYGKFDPSFHDKLFKEEEDTPVDALVSVKIPFYKPVPRPDITFPGGKDASPQTLEEIGKKDKELFASHFQPVFNSLIAKFKTKGYDVSGDTDGIISVKMSFKDLKEIQNWEEIDSIIDGTAKFTSDLASARAASGIAEVNKRNITGSGINVGQIEKGGHVKEGYPPGVTQDYNDVCTAPDDHATEVAGIIKSLNLANSGTAQSANLWASGACDGDANTLWHKIQQASIIPNANVINLSFGCGVEYQPIICTRYLNQFAKNLDGSSFNTNSFRPLIIKSAGNTAKESKDEKGNLITDGTGNIYDPAGAYNVLTVGSYVDNNNGDSSDDVMSDFSSWKNPTSHYGDREKPDVVAPGSKVRTTANTSPLLEVDGTSFSTPVVTGGSALLMQRYPNFRYEPEALKALIIATAHNNIEGDLIP